MQLKVLWIKKSTSKCRITNGSVWDTKIMNIVVLHVIYYYNFVNRGRWADFQSQIFVINKQ